MAGKRSRWRMRCRACRRAGRNWLFTLRRPLAKYLRPVRCPVAECESLDVVDFEALYLRSQENRRKRTPYCYCGPVPHPHVIGSHRLCEHHPLANVPLTEDEERQAMDVANNIGRTSNR